MEDEREALEPELIHERLEEAVVALDRVVEVARLGRLPEAGQVRSDAAGALEERQPVVRVRRHAVQVEDRRVAGLAVVDLEAGDLRAVFSHVQGRASYHHPAMADRRRVRTILERLRREYGRPVLRPHRAPVDELILTVLSQNTNDRNRDVAYARLRERFSSWAEVSAAPVEEVEDAIRPGGLAPTKAVRIKQILEALDDDDLAWMEEAPLERGARLPLRSARSRPQDRRLRAAVLVRPPRRAGGHARVPGGHPARALAAGHEPRARPRRDAAAGGQPGGGVRAARAADPARAQDLHGAQPRLPGVPAAGGCVRRAAAGWPRPRAA